MPFSCYISAHHEYTVVKYKSHKTNILYIWACITIQWVEQLHLYQGPTIEIFCVPKQTIKSPGGGGGGCEFIGIGIDRDMKKWELSKTVKLL